MKTEIANFTKADAIEVQSSTHCTCGQLVTLNQRKGSMSFQFDMRPEQALEFAQALTAAANSFNEVPT